jgi:hypothetical protein
MSIGKNILLSLIEERVRIALLEQAEQSDDKFPTPADTTDVDTTPSGGNEAAASPAPSAGASGTTGTSGTGSTSSATGGGVADGAAVAARADAGVDAGNVDQAGPEADSTDTSPAPGGASGGMSFSGSGSGMSSNSFGDKGAKGLDSDESEERNTLSTIGPEDVEIPSDPVGSIVDDATKMLNQTRNPQKILQNTKSLIQQYFSNFDDAVPIIIALWETEDVVLRDVARRLLLFIKGI